MFPPQLPITFTADRGDSGYVPGPEADVRRRSSRDEASPDLGRHRVDRAAVAGERVPDQGVGGQVPYPHRLVIAAGDGYGPAIHFRDCHRVDRASVAGERIPHRGASGQVPYKGRASSKLSPVAGRSG